MVLSNNTYNSLDNALLPAILISIGLHVLAAAFLHPFQVDVDRVLPSLEVVLQPPKPELPPPPPEPPKPEPPKPQPKKMLPPPVRTPLPPQPKERAIVPPPTVTPPPQVIATAPVKEVDPAFVAPTTPANVKKPVEPVPVDIDADLSKYGSMLAREYAKHKQYPRIAQMRGWQGKPTLEIHIDSNGNIISITIKNPSEYEALDKSALETARKVSPLPPIPESLRGKEFTLIVPFDFKLE